MLDYEVFYKWTKRNFNINLDGYKEKQLQRRIATIMKKSGSTTLEEYAAKLKEDPICRTEFLDYITINVTEFFRNKEIFDSFEKHVLELLVPKFSSLKAWSAACSIGAEPYSLAMMLLNNGIPLSGKILATDIDETVLNKAKRGIYTEKEIENINNSDRKRYFQQKDKHFYLQNEIKNKVAFKKQDLISDPFQKGFHVIVCRNVTIYFKNEIKNEIYQKISRSLVPGGLFFTGATETIYNPEVYGFKKITTFIYEKL